MENTIVYGPQIAIDRGLQSNSLSDVLSTISTYGSYVQDYPFPSFTNFVLLRLAETFNGEKFSPKLIEFLNEVRLRVVKSIKENIALLQLAFSGGHCLESAEEILRCVLIVSHSNDYRARSLTLLLLGALAPMIAENKRVLDEFIYQAHHLVIESLDAAEPTELAAAINASDSFGKFSSSFSSLFAGKLPELIVNVHNEPLLTRLLMATGNLTESPTLAKRCIESIAPIIAERSCSDHIRAAFYGAMTKLACRSRLTVPLVVGILLDALDKTAWNRALTCCLLKNLAKLASLSHEWDVTQTIKLASMLPKLPSSSAVTSAWLCCMETLLQSGLQATFLSDLTHPWVQTLLHPDFDIRSSAISLGIRILQGSYYGEAMGQLEGMLTIAVSKCIREGTEGKFASAEARLFKCLISYTQSASCPEQMIGQIADSLMDSAGALVEARDAAARRVETLCAICACHPPLYTQASKWASLRLQELITASKPVEGPFLPLCSLAMTPLERSEEGEAALAALVSSIIGGAASNGWACYRVARLALRHGRWRSVALPLLETLWRKCDNRTTRSWMNALLHVSRAEAAEVQKEATVIDDIDHRVEQLRTGALLIEPLIPSSGKRSKHFAFASAFLTCLADTLGTFRSILTLLNIAATFRLHGNRALGEDAKISLGLAHKAVAKARQTWHDLYLHSFDADEETRNTLHMWLEVCALVENTTYLVCGRLQKLPTLREFPNSARVSLLDRNMFSVLSSAQAQMQSLAHARVEEGGGELELVNAFKESLLQLCRLPIGLPRLFFQQIHSTSIKLNTIPQPKEGSSSIAVSATRLPLTIEGVIQTDNPSLIDTVTIELVVNFARNREKAFTKRQTIGLEANERYFKCQFMLNLSQAAELKLQLSFTDTVSKRTWLDDTGIQFAIKH